MISVCSVRQNHQSRAPEMYAFTARWLVLIIITLQNHLPCPYNFELVLDIEVFDYVENHYFLPTPSKDITLFLNYKINKLTAQGLDATEGLNNVRTSAGGEVEGYQA